MEKTKENFNKNKEELSIYVAKLYFDVLLCEKLKEVAKKQTDLTIKNEEKIQILVQINRVAKNDLIKAKSTVAQCKYAEIQAENNYNLAKLELCQALEIEEVQDLEIEDVFDKKIKKIETPEEIFKTIYKEKPEIKLAEIELKSAKKNIEIAEMNFLPKLGLQAGIKKDLSQNDFEPYLGIKFEIPIFNKFSEKNKLEYAKEDKKTKNYL